MKPASIKPVRCAIYTRVSTEHGLDQEFNSLDAQYEAVSAYIKSQAHAGWTLIRSRYDDGGYSPMTAFPRSPLRLPEPTGMDRASLALETKRSGWPWLPRHETSFDQTGPAS